jgi:superoxide reductase
MPKQLEIYKCEICGNIVEVLHSGAAPLVCCNQKMNLMEENTLDAAREKHVPVIEIADGKITVRVGSVPHPMEQSHYIEWIELLADGKAYRQFLQTGEKPEAVFLISAQKVTAREYCNLHGQWKAEA